MKQIKTFVMVDYVREMIAKKPWNHGDYRSLNHLFFSFHIFSHWNFQIIQHIYWQWMMSNRNKEVLGWRETTERERERERETDRQTDRQTDREGERERERRRRERERERERESEKNTGDRDSKVVWGHKHIVHTHTHTHTHTQIIIIIAFRGTIRDFLQSPRSAANCLQHIRSSGPDAIVCKPRATHQTLITCKCHVMCHLVRRDSSAIKFDRVEIAFIWSLFYWLNH